MGNTVGEGRGGEARGLRERAYEVKVQELRKG